MTQVNDSACRWHGGSVPVPDPERGSGRRGPHRDSSTERHTASSRGDSNDASDDLERIPPPKKPRSLEHRAIIFQTLLFESNASLKSSLQEQLKTQEAGTQIRIKEMTRINYDQIMNRIKMEASGARAVVFKIFRAVSSVCQTLPGVGPAMAPLCTKLMMCKSPSIGDVGIALIVLSSALKPLAELGFLGEGKDRDLSDVVGGEDWLAAVLTFDLGELMRIGVSNATDDPAALTAVTVLGGFMGAAISATAASQVSGGACEEGSDMTTLIKFAGVASRLVICCDGLGKVGEGNETITQANLRRNLADSEADLARYEAINVQKEESIEVRIGIYSRAVNLETSVAGFVSDVLQTSSRIMSAVWGGAEEGGRTAMA